jgi:YHS domain-containing protein
LNWRWQFKGDDAWITVSFAKSKNFLKGELRCLKEKDAYQFRLHTPAKKTLTFTGRLKDRRLTLDRTDPDRKEDQRLVFSLLHSNRFLYYYQVKPQGRGLFARVYQVGATKQGVAFATGEDQPECVVSGGQGTIKVMHKGKTYYVCCSGCKTEFDAHPDKYIKEYEQKMAKKAK